jgi:hypothetical protein
MNIFEKLFTAIRAQHQLLKNIADKLEQLEVGGGGGGGGGGNATISDYESGKRYKRNTLVVDPATETVYRVLPSEYTSITVEDDKLHGYLKLVGFESDIVTFDHNPSQAEIDALPDDSVVVIYSPTDPAYIPDT